MNNEVKENVIKEENTIPYEFIVKDTLAAKRKEIKTFEDLMAFLKDVEEHYNCGYGETVRAAVQAILAVGFYFSRNFGMTGFQASCVMWDFIKDWCYSSNKCGIKLVDYDRMLYPQYEFEYQKTISSAVWKNLQKQAKENLEKDNNYTSKRVLEHWESIAAGKVPFGYTVIDN